MKKSFSFRIGKGKDMPLKSCDRRCMSRARHHERHVPERYVTMRKHKYVTNGRTSTKSPPCLHDYMSLTLRRSATSMRLSPYIHVVEIQRYTHWNKKKQQQITINSFNHTIILHKDRAVLFVHLPHQETH